jgi:hypothetical protein
MLHVIVDDVFLQPKDLGKDFYSFQTWQMNVMNAINHSKGIAKFIAAQHGLPEGNWHLVRPIYWQATHNDVFITADCETGFTDKHLQHYFEVFQGFLERDEVLVHRLKNNLWLFDAQELPSIHSVSLTDVMHQSLYTIVKQMPIEWQTWFTEIQMLFHGLPTSGPYPVNGVWVWGGGEPPKSMPLKCLGDFKFTEHHQIANPQELKSGDVLLVARDKMDVLTSDYQGKLSSFREVHWWWNNKHYIVSKPSLWEKIKKWLSHEY